MLHPWQLENVKKNPSVLIQIRMNQTPPDIMALDWLDLVLLVQQKIKHFFIFAKPSHRPFSNSLNGPQAICLTPLPFLNKHVPDKKHCSWSADKHGVPLLGTPPQLCLYAMPKTDCHVLSAFLQPAKPWEPFRGTIYLMAGGGLLSDAIPPQSRENKPITQRTHNISF